MLRESVEWLLFGRRLLQPLYTKLYGVALAGMHYNRGWNVSSSGETQTVKRLAKRRDGLLVVFDVGASKGDYSLMVLKELGERVTLHSFEPSPAAFAGLQSALRSFPNACPHLLGFSDSPGPATLYSDGPGSPIGSIFKQHLVGISTREEVEMTSIDRFCALHAIGHIDLLKLDVEGNEYNVLIGAHNMLESGAIELIQFELGGGTIDARHYFRDFFDLLDPQYRLYRLVRDGLIPIDQYCEKNEIFLSANYLAERRSQSYGRRRE